MPDTFTPEQISQILEEFFKVVGTRQYIGARYVPIFGRKDETSIEWDNTKPYEPLTIVLYQGNSYTSRQFVPVGVEITNQEFWAITGNYNAQVEQYRRETAAAREVADNALTAANNAQTDIDTLLPKADFSAENTVKGYVDDSVAEVQADIDTLLPKADFSAENTVKKYVEDSVAVVQEDATAAQADIDTLLPKADFSAERTVKYYIDNAQQAADNAEQLAKDLNYLDNIELAFFGRIFNEVNTLEAQGMCIVNDTLGYAVFGQNTDASDHSAVVYKFNPKTGAVIEYFNRDLYHCNDMCYNATDDYVYVARLNNTTDTVLIRCAASTLNVIDTIDAGVPVFGCAYDKVTDKMYIYSKSSGTFHVYEFDPQTLDKTEMFSVSDAELGYGVGTQGLVAYDGTVSILMSSDSICQLVTKRDETLLTRNVSNTCFIYTAYEWQSGDYLADGTLFVNSIAFALNKICMCIGTYKAGAAIDQHYDLTMVKRGVSSLYLKPADVNANIRPSGSYNAAFATFDEAMRYVELTGSRLLLDGSGNIDVDYKYAIPFDVLINGNSTTRLLVTKALNFLGRLTLLNVNLDYVHPGTGYMITARDDVYMQGTKVKCLAASSGNRFMGLFTKCTLNNCTYENETTYQSYVMDGNGTCLFVANSATTGFNYENKGSVV